MADGSRIPRSIEKFNPFIGNTTAYLKEGLPTNADRLGILPAELTKWDGFLTAWTPLYVKYSDKKNSRTTAVKDQLWDIVDQCIDFDHTSHILDRIAASPNVTIVDMETFNIKKGVLQKNTRSVSNTPISELVAAIVQAIGGGSVTIKCYSVTGQRAAIMDDADSVQIAYSVGTTPPASVKSEGLTYDLSTKATFTLALGAENSAKYLYIYFRWYNTKHPELNGPWSMLETVLIM